MSFECSDCGFESSERSEFSGEEPGYIRCPECGCTRIYGFD